MFDLNLTLPIFLVMFYVFMTLLNELVLKPVGSVIQQRQEKIQKDIQIGSDARQNAAEIVKQYQATIQAARAEGQSLINEVMSKAQQVRQAELQKVQQEVQAKIQAERQKVAAERESLLDKLVEEEKNLVEMITKKLLGDDVRVNLDTGTIRRALEEAR